MATKRQKRQQEIPGTERESIEELDEAVAAYADALYSRMELQENEASAKQRVLNLLAQHDLKHYTYADGEYEFRVKTESKESLKCKRVPISDDDGVELAQ